MNLISVTISKQIWSKRVIQMLLSFGGGNVSTVTWGQYRTFRRGTWAHVLPRKGRGRLQASPGILSPVLVLLPYHGHEHVYLGIRVKRYCSEQFFLTRPSCCQNL